MNDFELPEGFNVFSDDLSELSAEQLIEIADQFVVRLIGLMYGPEILRRLDEDGMARIVAVQLCNKFLEVMVTACERSIELKSVKDYLNTLVDG